MEFPKGYFQEETRDGFTISEMMKRAWGAILEVLQVIDEICARNHITYYADGGTLLGAIRHHGFIPWDDDLDICLLRDEYKRLLAVLPGELPPGFVAAGMYADSKRLQQADNAAHLRVIADEEYWNFPSYLARFHGFPYPRIGIDIFPIDYLSGDQEVLHLQVSIYHMIHFTIQNWELYIKEGLLEQQLQEIERVCAVKLDRSTDLVHQLWLLADKVASQTRREDATEADNIAFMSSEQEIIHGRKLEWFAQAIRVPFECTTIPVPSGYEEMLTSMYGDYMTPVKGTANHDYPFYQKQEAEMKLIFQQEGITSSIEEFCHNWQKLTGEV